MPRVVNTNRNASGLVSRVRFEQVPGVGMVSEDIDAAQAARFASIPGYRILVEAKQPEAPVVPPAQEPPPAGESGAEGDAGQAPDPAADQPGGEDPDSDGKVKAGRRTRAAKAD